MADNFVTSNTPSLAGLFPQTPGFDKGPLSGALQGIQLAYSTAGMDNARRDQDLAFLMNKNIYNNALEDNSVQDKERIVKKQGFDRSIANKDLLDTDFSEGLKGNTEKSRAVQAASRVGAQIEQRSAVSDAATLWKSVQDNPNYGPAQKEEVWNQHIVPKLKTVNYQFPDKYTEEHGRQLIAHGEAARNTLDQLQEQQKQHLAIVESGNQKVREANVQGWWSMQGRQADQTEQMYRMLMGQPADKQAITLMNIKASRGEPINASDVSQLESAVRIQMREQLPQLSTQAGRLQSDLVEKKTNKAEYDAICKAAGIENPTGIPSTDSNKWLDHEFQTRTREMVAGQIAQFPTTPDVEKKYGLDPKRPTNVGVAPPPSAGFRPNQVPVPSDVTGAPPQGVPPTSTGGIVAPGAGMENGPGKIPPAVQAGRNAMQIDALRKEYEKEASNPDQALGRKNQELIAQELKRLGTSVTVSPTQDLVPASTQQAVPKSIEQEVVKDISNITAMIQSHGVADPAFLKALDQKYKDRPDIRAQIIAALKSKPAAPAQSSMQPQPGLYNTGVD